MEVNQIQFTIVLEFKNMIHFQRIPIYQRITNMKNLTYTYSMEMDGKFISSFSFELYQ
jgi:hypothetical protein